MQLVFIISGTIFAWAGMLGVLYVTHNIPRAAFVSLHYLVNIFTFTFFTITLRKAGVTYTAWVLMVVVVGILLALELFYWVFVNPIVAAQYLTVIDWVIHAILVSGTVYVVARLVR